MREERGQVAGDVVIYEPYTLWGSIGGNVNVIVHRGAKVIHSGMIGGDATNDGGRLYVDKGATVRGKVKTLKGETKLPPPRKRD